MKYIIQLTQNLSHVHFENIIQKCKEYALSPPAAYIYVQAYNLVMSLQFICTVVL